MNSTTIRAAACATVLFTLAVSCAQAAVRPIVAVADGCCTNTLVAVPLSAVEAVSAAGANPVFLPFMASDEAVGAVLDHVDMLLISSEGMQSPCREQWESRLRRLADARRVPGYNPARIAELASGRLANRKPAADGGCKLVAIPDYCATNGLVVAKLSLVDAIEKAGFAVYVVPWTNDDEVLSSLMGLADALMVGGGLAGLDCYAKRCELEIRAVKAAVGRGIPVAGVCHGEQVINVAFGGTLTSTPQEQGAQNPQIIHKRGKVEPWTDNYHVVETAPGSRIAGAIGAGKVVVNSSHRRCIMRLASGFKVTARAPDGVVEAIEHETLPVMAFQFHPERMTFDDRMVGLVRTALSPRKCAPAGADATMRDPAARRSFVERLGERAKAGRPFFIAHRGCQSLAPENSVASFVCAARLGLDAIETDVRLSSDGALVCVHDGTLKRMFGDGREVAAVGYDELRRLLPVNGEKGKVKGLKSWSTDALRIPTFAEYLDVCEQYDKVPFIETKGDVAVVKPVLEEVRRRGLTKVAVLSSIQFDHIREARRLDKEIFVHHIFSAPELLDELAAMGNAGLSYNYKDLAAVPEGLVERVHAKGVKMCLRAGDTPDAVAKMMALGLDYIPTNVTVPQ